MYARRLEEITETQVRRVPHWGKQNWATGEELNAFSTSQLPRVQRESGSGGVFINECTRERLSCN
jgi:hypothetical protein